MNGNIKIGAILHHLNFPFENGTKKHKYLVVLGAKTGQDYLCAFATSQQGIKKVVSGCHQKPFTHFFIPGGGKNFFPRDTWIVLSRPRILSRAEVIQKGMQNIIEVKSNLNLYITGEIRNCLKKSKDISKKAQQLL